MADEKVAPLLPLSVVFGKKKQAPAADPPFPGVRHVLIWALLNTGILAFSMAYVLIMPSWLLPRPTRRQEDACARAGSLVAGILLCAVSQAAAGALGLMLRRHQLLLAYAALVPTTASHCMFAGLHIMFIAADGGLSFIRGVGTAGLLIYWIGDMICFRGLLSLGEGEE